MSLTCPYCRTEAQTGDGSTIFCQGCGTPHHQECFDENGGCTLFGCKYAPPDEPKIEVTSREIGAPGAFLAGASLGPPTGFGDVAAPGAFRTVPSFGPPTGFGDAASATPRLAGRVPPPPAGRVPPPPLASSGGAPPPPLPAAPPPPAGSLAGTPGNDGYKVPGGILSPQVVREPKSRIAFVLLGIFLGMFGAHNFYAGYIARGLIQLGITVFTVFYGAPVSWIWAIVEIWTVDHDSHKTAFL